MTDKYSGFWHPGLNTGDGDERSPSPDRSFRDRASQFDFARRRDEERARVEAWMNGKEPEYWWEMESANWLVLGVYFPESLHPLVWVAELKGEYGNVSAFCETCRVGDCGACRWAISMYRKLVVVKRAEMRGDLFSDSDSKPPPPF